MRLHSLRRAACAAGLLLMITGWTLGQTLKIRPPAGQDTEQERAEHEKQEATAQAVEAPPVTVPMSVPSGTPIKVALDSEVRIRNVGQPIHGKTTEPVYAFDKLLDPGRHLGQWKSVGDRPVSLKRFGLCKRWTRISRPYAQSTCSLMNS